MFQNDFTPPPIPPCNEIPPKVTMKVPLKRNKWYISRYRILKRKVRPRFVLLNEPDDRYWKDVRQWNVACQAASLYVHPARRTLTMCSYHIVKYSTTMELDVLQIDEERSAPRFLEEVREIVGEFTGTYVSRDVVQISPQTYDATRNIIFVFRVIWSWKIGCSLYFVKIKRFPLLTLTGWVLTNDCSYRHSSQELTCANSRYRFRLDHLLVTRPGE